MTRRISVVSPGGTSQLLVEVKAHDELELQERMKDDPELLPIDEFGLDGPLLVVGRETSLASGSADLVGLSRGGDIVLIEFKTGPQNPDFRSALAQLLDYGADLWGMSFEAFDANVAARYFLSERCPPGTFKGCSTLRSAVLKQWPDETNSEVFVDRLREALEKGSFHYVVVAQRFTPAMAQTVRYLNETMPAANFYLVELVRFTGGDHSVFEARTVYKPEHKPTAIPYVTTSEGEFLSKIEDQTYKDALINFFDGCRSINLKFEWGSLGTSIRFSTVDKSEPVSVAWVFPPGVLGWMGLTNLTLGHDPTQTESAPSVRTGLEGYLTRLGNIRGAAPVSKARLVAYSFAPDSFVSQYEAIFDAVTQLVAEEPGG